VVGIADRGEGCAAGRRLPYDLAHGFLAQAQAHGSFGIQHQGHGGFAEHRGLDSSRHDSFPYPIFIAPEPAHAVAADAAGIGGHQDFGRIRGFLGGQAQLHEHRGAKSFQILTADPRFLAHDITPFVMLIDPA